MHSKVKSAQWVKILVWFFVRTCVRVFVASRNEKKKQLSCSILHIPIIWIYKYTIVRKWNITSLPPVFFFFTQQEIVHINCDFSLSDSLPSEGGDPEITWGSWHFHLLPKRLTVQLFHHRQDKITNQIMLGATKSSNVCSLG